MGISERMAIFLLEFQVPAVVPNKFTSKGVPATMMEMAPRLANLEDGSRKGTIEMHTKIERKLLQQPTKHKKCVITVNRS